MILYSSGHNSPTVYSNPEKLLHLPPLNAYPKWPLDRIALDEKRRFHFMGREKFSDIYHAVDSMADNTSRSYSPQGSLGYRKSRIFAALVCLLMQQRRRIVYLPDSRAMTSALVKYTKQVLLLMFADDSRLQVQINMFSTTEELVEFADEFRNNNQELYSVVDQLNALDTTPGIVDTLSVNQKKRAMPFTKEITFEHFYIWSASGTYEKAPYDNSRQDSGATRIVLCPGLSKIDSLISRFIFRSLTKALIRLRCCFGGIISVLKYLSTCIDRTARYSRITQDEFPSFWVPY